MFEQLLADPIEPVFDGFSQAHIEEFRQGGAPDPIDERPFAKRLDKADRNHYLRGGDGGGVHAEVAQHQGEIQRIPGFHGHELGPEFDDLFGLDFVEQDAVDDRAADRCGGTFGTFGEAGDANGPSDGFRRESSI